MSGIEISEVARERDTQTCASCMNAVTQTFGYFQEQIKKLRSEKAYLEEEIEKVRRVGEEQTRDMAEEIRSLEEEVAMLKKESESLKESAGSVAQSLMYSLLFLGTS